MVQRPLGVWKWDLHWMQGNDETLLLTSKCRVSNFHTNPNAQLVEPRSLCLVQLIEFCLNSRSWVKTERLHRRDCCSVLFLMQSSPKHVSCLGLVFSRFCMIWYDFAESVGKPQQLWTMRLVSFLCDFRQDQGLRPCSQVSCSSELAAPAGTILVAFNFFRCHPRKINQDLYRFIKYQTKHQ